MALYLLTFLSLLIYDRFVKDKRIVCLAFSLQLFLILAFRADTLGYDLENYIVYYKSYQQYSLGEMVSSFRLFSGSKILYGLESGYVFLNWLIGKIGFDFYGYLVIHAAICVSSMSLFIYRYSDDVPMSYALFLSLGGFSYFFGILRQSLGVAAFLCAIPALKERKMIRYFAWVILAMLCHRICILAVPLYFVADWKINIKRSLLVGIVTIVIVLITPVLGKFVLAPILTMVSKSDMYPVESFQWNNMFPLMSILFGGSVLVLYNQYQNYRYEKSFLVWIMAASVIVQAIAFYIPIFSRAAMGLFLPAGYVIVTDAARRVNEYISEKWQLITRMTFFGLLFVFYIYIMNGDIITPYRWIFS